MGIWQNFFLALPNLVVPAHNVIDCTAFFTGCTVTVIIHIECLSSKKKTGKADICGGCPLYLFP